MNSLGKDVQNVMISAGQGPVECHWVIGKITTLFLQACDRHNVRATITDSIAGKAPNCFRSIVLELQIGSSTTDILSSWIGTIQWIGNSMFRTKHKRKNWYVGIQLLENNVPIALNEKDLRIETKRASGPGGQHVNTTDSAVRVTHMPTGTAVVSHNNRSQHRNRAKAYERMQQRIDVLNEERTREYNMRAWYHHYGLERGNPVRVYKGKQFIKIKGE